MSGSALPKKVGDVWFYECGYENPHPEKMIAGVAYEPAVGKENIKVITRSVEFYTEATPLDDTSSAESEKAVLYE